jgi:hydroxymethylbilane synthase
MSLFSDLIIVGARESKLSQAQVAEVQQELCRFHPRIRFEPLWQKTIGDRDLAISLRDLGKTNFFTKEIDDMLLEKKCRIAIHSAKDLPDPLPCGLVIVAITQGVDPADALVLREGDTMETLPLGAIIGTSSGRRDAIVKALRSDLNCRDIRGPIEKRLALLDEGIVDGVVIAEAALIRLNLTHRNRLRLNGETAPLQGRLAVIARENDAEMAQLFSSVNVQ